MINRRLLQKSKAKMMRQLKKQLGFRHIPRRFDQRRLSSFGGYVDIVNFSRLLGLQKSIAEKFQPKKSEHRFYSDADLCQRLLDITLLDVDRIDNADLLYDDKLLQYLHDFDRDPSPATLRRELESCYARDIAALEQINADMLQNQSHLCPPREVTLVIDVTPVDSYGNQQGARRGFNHYSTEKCYQVFLGAIQETADLIKIDLKPGNFVPSAEAVIQFLLNCLALIPSHLKVTCVRLDCGFWSFPVINLLDAKGLNYYVKGSLKNNTPLANLPAAIPEEDWTRIPRTKVWVSRKMNYYAPMYKKEYPVIFIREQIDPPKSNQTELPLGPFYSYHPLFCKSLLDEVKSYGAYNKGAIIEDVVKELKNEFFIDKIPSHRFKATHAFLKIKAIAYNLLNSFKRFVLGGRWATKSAKAIRNWIIKTPCLISGCGRGIESVFADNLKLRTLLASVSSRVQQIAWKMVT